MVNLVLLTQIAPTFLGNPNPRLKEGSWQSENKAGKEGMITLFADQRLLVKKFKHIESKHKYALLSPVIPAYMA